MRTPLPSLLLTASLVASATIAAALPAGARPLSAFMSAPPPQDIIYARRDGRDLVMHAFKPADWRASARRPAVVWIHGGAWVGGSPEGSLPFGRYFADRGAVAFVITYRKACPEGPGVEDCLSDCRAAVRHIRRHAAELGVDPARIAVIGESAGGHLAAALATLPDHDAPDDAPPVSSRPDTIVLFNPIVDMTEDDWVRYAVGGPALADKSLPRPADEASLAKARALSPLFHIAPGQPPALVVHGRGDKVVPWHQSQRFADAMKTAGNRCDLVLYGPEIGHAFAIAAYKWPESVVVPAIREADKFLVSLGWLEGEPTLAVSKPPAW